MRYNNNRYMWNVHSCYERLLTGLLGMLSIRWCKYFKWFGSPEISRGKERFYVVVLWLCIPQCQFGVAGKWSKRFLLATPFFNSVLVLLNSLMNWLLNVALVLLGKWGYYVTVRLFGFSLFISMSTSGFIYVWCMWSVFHYYFHFYHN